MKAVVIQEYGGIERLEYKEVETPVPGPGEVLVRVRAAGLNHLDHDVREGVSGFPVTLPHVPGIEGSGEVAELGPGVSSTKVGARVSINLLKSCGQCRNCLGGQDNICLNGEVLGVGMWGSAVRAGRKRSPEDRRFDGPLNIIEALRSGSPPLEDGPAGLAASEPSPIG